MRAFTALRDLAGRNRDRLMLAVSTALFLLIVAAERLVPANVVGAYGFVLPILLVATLRNRRLMFIMVTLCVVATYAGLLTPTKPGRFLAAVINRTVVVAVLAGVGYFALTREERKGREEAARAELALQTEHLLRANAQLVEIKNALSRSERLAAVGQLVASVAHEVGTPLHSIAWHVQALSEDANVTPEMRKRIAIIDSQIGRVVRIIEDLLSSTQPRKPSPAHLPVDRLVYPVTGLMGPSFAGKGVALKVELGTDLPAIWGDAEQLQQVLINLMTNALAATNSGGEVAITAGSRPATSPEAEAQRRSGEIPVEQMITLTVKDTGCGMPEEHLKRVFEPFFTSKVLGDGTGLGLFLSHEIVAAHGGSLSLESAVGKGTTVVVALPSRANDSGDATGGTKHGA